MKRMISFLIFLFSYLASGNSIIEDIQLNTEINYKYYTEEDFKKLPITIKSLKAVIDFYEIDNLNIVLRQAIHETARFNSSVFKDFNNLFGMKHPRVRESVSRGLVRNGYASYDTWVDSVKDYKLWQDMVEIEMDYFLYLQRRSYAEDARYVNKLKRINI